MHVGAHHSTSFIMNHGNSTANPTLTQETTWKKEEKPTFSPSFGKIFGSFTAGGIHHLQSQNGAHLPQNLTLYLPAVDLCDIPATSNRTICLNRNCYGFGKVTQLFCSELPDFPIQVWKTSGGFLMKHVSIKGVSSSFPVGGWQKWLKAVG